MYPTCHTYISKEALYQNFDKNAHRSGKQIWNNIFLKPIFRLIPSTPIFNFQYPLPIPSMLDSIAAREQRIRLEQFPTHSKQVQWQEFSNDTTQFEKKRNDSLALAKKKKIWLEKYLFLGHSSLFRNKRFALNVMQASIFYPCRFFSFFISWKILFFFNTDFSRYCWFSCYFFLLLFLRGAFPYFYGALPNLFEISIRLDIFKVLHMSATQVSLLKTEEEKSWKVTKNHKFWLLSARFDSAVILKLRLA